MFLQKYCFDNLVVLLFEKIAQRMERVRYLENRIAVVAEKTEKIGLIAKPFKIASAGVFPAIVDPVSGELNNVYEIRQKCTHYHQPLNHEVLHEIKELGILLF